MYDAISRERKARTMTAVLGEFCSAPLDQLCLLDVGGSTGIIDNFLADHFASVVTLLQKSIKH